MVTVTPSGKSLGARVTDIDLAEPLDERTFAVLLGALAHHGILCFTGQTIDARQLRDFSANFGTLEVNVANAFQAPSLPEVMILSNIRDDPAFAQPAIGR
jgi:taurine dioxygenase